MKKSLSIALILVYLSALAYPVAVFAGEPQGQPDEIIEENPDYLPNKQDAQFAERSQVGEKWTFKKIPHDFAFSYKEAFWGWGALGFAAGAGLSAGLYPLDDNVKNALGPNEIFGSTGNTVIGWTLSPYTYAGVSIILWGVGAGTKHPKLALTGRALTEAIGFAMVMTAAGKFAFRRTRPDGGSLSFPSAHATAAFAASGVLTVFYGWKGGLASYPLAFLVSLSRLDEQKHWLSDVVMGATIGTVIGVGTAKLLKKENPNLFIFPEVRRDEVSLNVLYRF